MRIIVMLRARRMAGRGGANHGASKWHRASRIIAHLFARGNAHALPRHHIASRAPHRA